MSKRALCVGINNYPGVDSDLSGCVNDCRDWQSQLGSRGFMVDTLFDEGATKVAMVRALVKLLDASNPGDSVIFTYSGHGTWIPDLNGDEPDGRDEALCPYDLSETNLLLDDELCDIIGNHKKPGVQLAMVLDCCHSGTMTRVISMNPGHTKARYLPPSRFVKSKDILEAISMASPKPKTVTLPGIVMMAGCRDSEYSYDAHFDGKPNGAFTYFALQALKKNPANYGAWMQLIKKSLPSPKYPQTPQIQATNATKLWSILS